MWNLIFCIIIALLLIVSIVGYDDELVNSSICGITCATTIFSLSDIVMSYFVFRKLACENNPDVSEYHKTVDKMDELMKQIQEQYAPQIDDAENYVKENFDAAIFEHFQQNQLSQHEKEYISSNIRHLDENIKQTIEILLSDEADEEVQELADFEPEAKKEEVNTMIEGYLQRIEKRKGFWSLLYILAIIIFLSFCIFRWSLINEQIQNIMTVGSFLLIFLNTLFQNYYEEKYYER